MSWAGCQRTVTGLKLTTETGGLAKTVISLAKVNFLIIADAIQRLATKNRPKIKIFNRILPKKTSTFHGWRLSKTENDRLSKRTVSQGLLGCPTCQSWLKIYTKGGLVDAKYIIQKRNSKVQSKARRNELAVKEPWLVRD